MAPGRTCLLLMLILLLLGLLGLWLTQPSFGDCGSEKSGQQHMTNDKKSVPHWGKRYFSVIIKNGTIRDQCKSKSTFHGRAGAMECKIPIHFHCDKKKRCQLSKQAFKQIHCVYKVPGQLPRCKSTSSPKRGKCTVAQDRKPEVSVHFEP